MTALSPRIRLGLYGVVLLALVTAAVIALFSIGSGDDRADAERHGPALGQHRTSNPDQRDQRRQRQEHRLKQVLPGSSSTPTAPATTPPSSTPPTPAAPAAPPNSGTPMASHSPKPSKPKIYTVQPGDNLTVIAQWFHVRGYAPLYAWNKTVIGKNPDLIYPGQKIIVVPGGSVSVSSHR